MKKKLLTVLDVIKLVDGFVLLRDILLMDIVIMLLFTNSNGNAWLDLFECSVGSILGCSAYELGQAISRKRSLDSTGGNRKD